MYGEILYNRADISEIPEYQLHLCQKAAEKDFRASAAVQYRKTGWLHGNN